MKNVLLLISALLALGTVFIAGCSGGDKTETLEMNKDTVDSSQVEGLESPDSVGGAGGGSADSVQTGP
ncbi:MAG: hypothetical protein KDC26_01915 [Armatimonadetes bacterium]|nr:hypothetical protein [Armatimonadota bacterium]